MCMKTAKYEFFIDCIVSRREYRERDIWETVGQEPSCPTGEHYQGEIQ